MSFILDALKKSENERQRRTGPSLADVRAGAPERRRPPWLLLASLLLAVNLIIVLAVVLWPKEDPAPPAIAAVTPGPPPQTSAPPVDPVPLPAPPPRPAAEPAPAPRPAVRPLAEETASPRPAPPAAVASPSPVNPPETNPPSAAAPVAAVADGLPTLNELIVDGRINLPSLHVDIHVYSRAPPDRFVFINNRKYREGDQLGEGPRVEEISKTGVVLNHRGQRFLLPRD